MNILFWGLRIDPKDIPNIEGLGDITISDPHVTFEFFGNRNVSEELEEQISMLEGKEAKISVRGLGSYYEDGVLKNVGLLVSLGQDTCCYFKGVVPHITTGVFSAGKAKNTCRCDWVEIKPITITGVFHAWRKSS